MTKTVTLGEICEQITDGVHNTVIDDAGGDCLLLSAKNIKDGITISENERKINRQTLEQLRKRTKTTKDDVLLTSVGTIGETAIITDDNPNYEFQRSVAILKPDKTKVVPQYLRYYLMSRKDELDGMATGAVQKCLFIGQIKGYKLTLPTLTEQERVAEVLADLDAKIDLNRALTANLERLAAALFAQTFTQNPDNSWKSESLDENIDFLNGLAMQKFPKVEGKPRLPVIKIREMSSGITSATDFADAEIPKKYIVHNGDLLFSWSGTLLVKFWAEGDGALNQHLFKVSSEKYPEWFYYLWLQHHLASFIHTAKTKATTMGHIQRKHLHDAKILIPSDAKMRELDAKFAPIIEQMKGLLRETQTLTTTRDYLLPRLIDGRVKLNP